MAERAAAREAETKARQADLRAKKEQKEAAGGGLKAPSRLSRPTASATATEERKQKLLEKQKLLAEKSEQKKTGTTTASSRIGMKRPSAAATSRIGGLSASKIGSATAKVAEDVKSSRLATKRNSISGSANRPGIRGPAQSEEKTGAATSRLSTAR